jgi:hypothetical protein
MVRIGMRIRRRQRRTFLVSPPRRPRAFLRLLALFVPSAAAAAGLSFGLGALDLAPHTVYLIESFMFGVLIGAEVSKVYRAWMAKAWHEYDRRFGRWMIGELNAEFDRRHRQI